MTKDVVPDNFTLSLVIVDAIPVFFFGASAVVISLHFDSKLFLAGALLCLISGMVKVLWKLIVVTAHKNVWPLFLQMRILMPMGFLMILAALLVNHSKIRLASLAAAFCSFPSVIFFVAGIIGMIFMCIFAVKLDSSDLRANWIEQLTNGIAQICIFIGLLLL